VPETVSMAEKPGCAICEYVVKEVVDFLGDNRTAVAIEAALESVCNSAPRVLKVQLQPLLNLRTTSHVLYQQTKMYLCLSL
jgi:hypothetical protein